MGGVVSAIGNVVGDVASGVGDVLGGVGGFVKNEAPVLGGIAGGLIGGPWGAAAGSALGEAVKGGNLKQDLTAGAISGLGAYAGGELFGGAGAGAGGGTADALGSAGATDYLGAGIGDLYGAAPVQIGAGAVGSAGAGAGDVLGAFNAAGASGLTGAGIGGGVAGGGLGGASASDASGTPWWQSLGGGGTSATPDTSALAAGGAPGAAGGQGFGQLTGVGGAPLTAGVAGGSGAGGAGGIGGIGGNLMNWITAHPAAALQLGMAAYGATQKPQLPSALKTLQSSATGNLAGAQSVINSGGTSSPNWGQQKTTIDQSIDEQVKQATQALLQNAANNGLSPDSMVVKQQIAELQSRATTQKNTLYQQALQQNVSEAMSLLSGGSSALTSIGQAQLQSDSSAQQLVAALAGNALRTSSLQGQTPQTLAAAG